jgi:hypothetical protein
MAYYIRVLSKQQHAVPLTALREALPAGAEAASERCVG